MRALPLAFLIAMLALPRALDAQLIPVGARPAIGINGVLARPIGEFQQFVDWGGGLGLYGVFPLDRAGVLSLRLDGSAVIYGHERYSVAFLPVTPRVLLDVSTDNHILSLGLGPQVTFGTGAVQPYLFGTAGFSYFATVSSVSGTRDSDPFASTTNFDDWTFAAVGGGGMLLRLTYGRHPISLDLSAQTMYNGEAEYLTKGGIVDQPNGTVAFVPIRSATNLVTFRAGVAIGL